MAQQDKFPHFRLMDLPPELRNRIYEFALTSPDPVMLPSACKHKKRREAVQPALTKTNRQIREECLPVFYFENTFNYHLHGCDFGYFIDYMDIIGPKDRKHIHRVTLSVKDRLSCGRVLHDFARWCAQVPATEAMIFELSGHDWHMEYKDAMSAEEKSEMEKDTRYYTAFLGHTGLLLASAVIVSNRLCDKKTTKDLQVRHAWEEELNRLGLNCVDCERSPFARGDLEKDMDFGHCSDMCRFLQFGTACSETDTEESGEDDAADKSQDD